ncbi:MAG: adenosylhomocysteinase, partial [Bacteroidaceae bacterium]|nr:adenosylhomocysteinase [Bacteroidaceae bacterium]
MNKIQAIETLISPYYRENEYPVCCSQAIAWRKNRPFENLTVLDATPIFRNTMVKYKALLAGGARLLVGRATGFPCDEKIVAFLQEIGMPVISSEEAQTEPVDVILDCAASFIHWTARLGTVELTRSGVPKYAKKDGPVFVADGGRIKKIETCLGTGESYFRAMAQLGYTGWTGKRLVIFGSGKVGTGLLTYAKKNGAIAIVVTQPASVSDRVRKLADAIVNCTDIRAVVNAVSDAHAVVTATGIAGALSHPDLVEALIHSPALLANMGVEDEFGAAMPC